MFTRDDTLKNKQVEIREIIATQIESKHHTYGEFTGAHFVSNAEKQQAALESGDSVVNRMAAHVKEVADEALKIHLQHNFIISDDISGESKPILIEDNENNITRLSFQEFHFYPYEQRGPLSMNDFNLFIELIDNYASTLPVNFHMLIATLPVVDEYKRVYNMCVYVQSGTPTKIHAFAKNMPSPFDLEYAGTMTSLLTGGSQEISLIKEVTTKHHTRATKEKLVSDQLPDLLLTTKTHADLAINYDGTIHCSTAGGEQFTTIVDICLDHAYGVGFSRFNSSIKRLAEEKSFPIPRLMSHMVTSNTIDLSKQFIFGRFTAHADAKSPTVKDAFSVMTEDPAVIPLNNTTFGGKINLHIFSSHPVESLRGHHQVKVDLHNLRVELKKFESAKSSHRTFNSSVQKRIAVLREKIESLSQDDNALTRLDTIANTLQRLDLEHLTSRTWVNGYINLLTNSISSFINGDRSDDVTINIHDYISAIRSEWTNDNYSKHDKLANLLDEIEMLLHVVNKKRDTLSLNQPPLS